ncbi:MAG: NAD(P)-dependent oxidoreductase [Pseudomonadota bacterium]|nr:NAD(P)-dependent oxidoreductase [Pseudomonadota bacterium]
MTTLKTLVLGGSGHIGKRLLELLAGASWAAPSGAGRSPRPGGSPGGWIKVDTCDAAGLTAALQGFEAVVNCVAGDGRSIAQGAQVLAQAARSAGCRRIVHLSTQSVYGPREGRVREDSALDASLGWYGRAKCEAERHIAEFARHGGEVVMLRPGCVYGPGSELWVGRIGRWLQAGRLGDLGIGGDGWSNLVHVDDVCQALMAALQLPLKPGQLPVFNLAAPDSPRWNEYFVDLALQLGATPVRRIGQRQLRLDAFVASPPLKVAQWALKHAGRRAASLPEPMPPGLLRLWSQHLQLDARLASAQLALDWTPYAKGLQTSAVWLGGGHAPSTSVMDKAACMH